MVTAKWRTKRRAGSLGVGLALALSAGSARAAEPLKKPRPQAAPVVEAAKKPATQAAPASVSSLKSPPQPALRAVPLAKPSVQTADGGTEPPSSDRGALIIGAKVGGLVPISGLGANVRGAIELGYIAPWAKRSFAFVLDVGYAAPAKSGSESGDPRVPGGAYSWHLTEQELTVMPTLVYRLTAFGPIVPYGGIGPRLYLLQSNVKGDVAGVPIAETTERSTKLGLGIPLGVQYTLGPGALGAELLLEYGALDHRATGDSNTAAASLFLGYRLHL